MNQDKIRDALQITEEVEVFLIKGKITKGRGAKLLHGANKLIREYLNAENEEACS